MPFNPTSAHSSACTPIASKWLGPMSSSYRARTAFGWRLIPTPRGLSSATASSTRQGTPICCNVRATLSPPIPPPAMSTGKSAIGSGRLGVVIAAQESLDPRPARKTWKSNHVRCALFERRFREQPPGCRARGHRRGANLRAPAVYSVFFRNFPERGGTPRRPVATMALDRVAAYGETSRRAQRTTNGGRLCRSLVFEP